MFLKLICSIEMHVRNARQVGTYVDRSRQGRDTVAPFQNYIHHTFFGLGQGRRILFCIWGWGRRIPKILIFGEILSRVETLVY